MYLQKPAAKAIRKTSAQLRTAKYGMANQMAHEMQGRINRDNLRKRLDYDKAEVKRKAARRVRSSTGMNAGTLGAAHLSMFR